MEGGATGMLLRGPTLQPEREVAGKMTKDRELCFQVEGAAQAVGGENKLRALAKLQGIECRREREG